MAYPSYGKESLGKDGKECFDRYTMEFDDIGGGIEPHYFTILRLLRMQGYKVSKVHDVFASSEMSSFWGDMARRRGEQENRAMQLMGTLNGMLKDLFKVMREASILDERLGFYEGFDKGNDADDSALKDIWISLVEGGSKNPTSVIGLASQVGFVSLPDYFYLSFVKKREEIDGKIKSYDISEKLSYTLKRKLEQFLMWKERTHKELKTRQKFVNGMLKTLISEIRLYVQWVKPYIKSVRKLQDASLDKPDLVTAFETSFLEVEMNAFPKGDFGNYVVVAKVMFEQTTSPGEVYQRNYQKGFVHRGRVKIVLEGWVYTKHAFEKEKAEEDEDLIGFLSKHVDESIESMKDDLVKIMNKDYESLWKKKKDEDDKSPKTNFFKEVFPFLNYLLPKKKEEKKEKGSGLLSAFNPKTKMEKTSELNKAVNFFKVPLSIDREEPGAEADPYGRRLYNLYKVFKAVNGMLGPP